jgi:tetratricopeptide (TPR) repeat protein
MTDAVLPDEIPAGGSDRGDAMRNALRSMQMGREDEAETWLRAIVDEESELNQAWTALGVLINNIEGMEQQACRAFLRALELDRTEPMSWAALAASLHEQGHPSDAEATYRQGLVHDPEHRMSLLGLAQILRGIEDRRNEALEILRAMLRREPDTAGAWDLLGAIMEEDLGDLEEAETAYRRSIAIDPSDPEIWDRLGRMLERKVKDRWGAYRLYQQSVDYDCSFALRSLRLTSGITLRALILPPIISVLFTTAAEKANSQNRYRAMRFWAWLGRIAWPGRTRPLCQLGVAAQYGFADYDKAERTYRKAIAKEPRNEWPWRLLGILLVDVRGDYDEGAEVLERATRLDPFNSHCWSLLGRCYERRGELDRAERAQRRAIDVDEENPTPWVYLGEHFSVRRGNPEEAIRNYDQALHIDPNYTDAWVCKGIALMSGLKDYAGAEKCFRQAVELNALAPNAWRCLGTVLYKHLDQAEGGETCLRKAISLEPDSWSAEVHLAVLLYRNKGEFDEAEALLRGLVDRRVYLAHSLAALLNLYAAKGDPAGGRALAEEILAERPDDFDTLNYLAWTVHEEKLEALYGVAEEWSRRAVALQPGVIPFLHSLTELLFDQGRTDEALAEAEPVYEAVLARTFPASDVREALGKAATEGHERAVFWNEKIDTHCD